MTRRHLLDLAARTAALPGSAAFLTEWLKAASAHHQSHAAQHDTGAPPEPAYLANYRPRFFDAEDFEALQSFTEILIPTDETPGAREAHCAHFIDFVLASAAEAEIDDGHAWHDAMQLLKQAGFHTAQPAERRTLIESISRPERDHSAQHPAFRAYLMIKRENAFAFYTSRAGLIETLDYRGNTYNVSFPGCNHPEHHAI